MRSDKPKILLALTLFVAVVLLVGCPRQGPTGGAADQAPPASADLATIRIGSWNIEWLDQPGMRSGPARGVQQNPEDLADYIEASGASLIALQEIMTNAADGSPTNATLNEVTEILADRGAGDWWHVAFPSGRNQNVGAMWNADVLTLLNSPEGYLIPIEHTRSAQDRVVWSRPPRALFFSAGEGLTDFVIVPIHMKSDYGGDFSVHRAAEADALVAALPSIRREFRDGDLIIIGDTNSPHHADDSIRAYEEAGLTDLNDDDAITYWRKTSLDRALVPMDQPEFASPEFKVFYDEYRASRGISDEDFKRRWSDHRMVCFTLRVMPDDD